MPTSTDGFSPNGVALTTKELLIEVYQDMKFVRPAVENLIATNVSYRLDVIEKELVRIDAAKNERTRIGSFSVKAIGAIVLIGQFVSGVIYYLVQVANQR